MSEKKRIPLNLMLSYPVRWNEYQVLRDFVQNFYDASGKKEWNDSFSYSYSDECLTMNMPGEGFSYEWLLHIGATTKGDRDDVAGYFGEGFKIAALCAVRDYKWTVCMMSRDWCIQAVRSDFTIDGMHREQLVYDMETIPHMNGSRLILTGVDERQYRLFLDVLLSFYYPENALFGKMLYTDWFVGVYERSPVPVPACFPQNSEFGDAGVVYARYQALGTLPIPLIIADHTIEQEDRERKKLYNFDVLKIMYRVSTRLSPEAALRVLGMLRNKWNAYPEKLVDMKSWYYVVCKLIRRVSRSEDMKERFIKENPFLLYTERFIDDNSEKSNRRREARAWMRRHPLPYRLVMEQFKLLGVPKLEDVCREDGGFADDTMPNDQEKKYLSILEEMKEELFDGFFPGTEEVKYMITRGDRAAWKGKAELFKNRSKEYNSRGYLVKRKIESIAIHANSFVPDQFSNAVSTYVHELCHMFGGDNTVAFSHALTGAIEILVQNTKAMERYKEKWDAVDLW